MTPLDIKRRHMRIVEMGCIACHKFGHVVFPEEHHLNDFGHAGQERRGPQCTIGLCRWHHRGVPVLPLDRPNVFVSRLILGPSLFHESVQFRKIFGSDDDLLAETNRVIGEN